MLECLVGVEYVSGVAMACDVRIMTTQAIVHPKVKWIQALFLLFLA
jgi:hypothetical protein